MVFPKCRVQGILKTNIRYIRRQYATSTVADPSNIRNMALVAHIGSTSSFLILCL